MSRPPPSEEEREWLEQVGALGAALLAALAGFEVVLRRLHPPDLASLRHGFAPLRTRLDEAARRFAASSPPAGLRGLAAPLTESADHARKAASLFVDEAPASEGVGRILAAMREHCRAQDTLFPLRSVFPSIDRFFLQPDRREPDREEPPGPGAGAAEAGQIGLFTAHNAPDERGGFTLYVPETYDGSAEWPLVVALHGGSGHGADFLWTWLREARSRDVLLLAPTSRASTWSLMDPRRDDEALRSMIDHVAQRWSIDRTRLLLTGLSDGGTFTLLAGLSEASPFTALAPVSGVLHPLADALGHLDRASGRRIYLIHGALDWMFPVQTARDAARVLEGAGADLTYREIADLSHAYPREENARILDWLGAGRAR